MSAVAVYEQLVEFDPVPIPPATIALERTLGAAVVGWIEDFCVHGPGDVQGERVHLDDEEVAFILRCYEIDGAGRKVQHRASYSRPKGRRKSELAAFIACAELLGPVRFSHFDEAGMPVGKPVVAPLIKCVATEEGQADNVYGVLEFVLSQSKALRAAYPGLDVGRTRVFAPGGGKIVPISARASSKDGGRETFVVFDETHLYVTDELRALHQVLRRNLTKRKMAQPWCLEVSTMYAPGENSVAEGAHRTAQRIAAGDLVDIGTLYDHRQGPPLEKTATDAELLAGLALAYGAAAAWQDLDRRVAEFRDPENEWNDCLRYFMNVPAERRAGKWISDEQWRACANVERVIPAGAEIVVAVDAAHTRDTTACVLTWESLDGRRVQRSVVWSCVEEAPHDVFVPGGRLDNDLVRDFIIDLADEYVVRLVLCDERYFHDQAHELSEAGFVSVEVAQGSTEMLAAWDTFYGLVVGGLAPVLEHDGDVVYAQHVRNAVGMKTERGWKVSKKSAVAKIDACAAGAMSAWGSVNVDALIPESEGSWRPL